MLRQNSIKLFNKNHNKSANHAMPFILNMLKTRKQNHLLYTGSLAEYLLCLSKTLSSYMRGRILLLAFACLCVQAIAEKVSVTTEPLWLYKIPTAKPQTPSLASVSNGYYIELADHQVNVTNQTEYLHTIRHIVNESGVQNASEVSVTFAPEFQQVYFHKVTLWRGGKVISQLNQAQIKVVQEETDAHDFQYNGLKRAFVIVKRVQKEDRIEYAYSVAGFNPVFDNHFSDKVYFANSTIVTNYFETYIIPAGRKLHIKLFNNAPAPSEITENNRSIYHWSNPQVKLQESQPGVPAWFDNYPYVTLSEFSDWKDVTDWGVKLFKNYNYPLTGELENRIKKWRLIANGDKDLYANMAIRFVQDQVRYLGLEIGAFTHQPHPPATVYHQRFGDCKDKALLLVTLLQHENIPAWVALVNTVSRSKLAEAAPSTGEFDHAIVAIERSSGFIYIDATAAYQRGEIVNTYIPDYGYALLLRSGGDKLQPVSPGFVYSTNIEETLEAPYTDSCRLQVTSVYIGGAADDTRSNLAENSSKELEDTYVRYYNRTYNGIRMISPLAISDDSSKNEITVTEDYRIPSLWHSTAKGKTGIDVFTRTVYDYLPDPSNTYNGAPLAIPFPRMLHYTLEIKMPEEWQFQSEAVHLKNASYQFDFTPEVIGNRVRLRYYYQTFRDHIPANEVAQYKIDYKKIENIFNFSLYYTDNTNSQPNYLSERRNKIIVNWLMVLLALLAAGAATLMAWHLNKQQSQLHYEAGSGWPLGGWVLVLGITLGASAIYQLYDFIKTDYFSAAVWNTLEERGGQYNQFIFATEMAFSIFWLASVASLSYWFLKRRDIFPRIFIAYVASLVIGQLVLLTLYNTSSQVLAGAGLQGETVAQLIRTAIYGAIWTSYVIRSERVKATFTVPFS